MRARIRRKRGFSLIELMIVVVITSLMALIAAPRFTTLMQRNALRSSRQQIEAMVATARSAAIQKGRTAAFYFVGGKIGVAAQYNDAGAWTHLVPAVRLDSIHKGMQMSIGGTTDTVVFFSPRGYATPRLGGTVVYRLQMGTRRDSTCVSTIGHILGQACTQ